MSPPLIRLAKTSDEDAVWKIFHAVIQTGDTYVYLPDTPKADLEGLWLAPTMHTYVAEIDGDIVGTFILKANHPGLGSHVANASYMVHPDSQGQGIGSVMCEFSMSEARRLGFSAMQFNLVVSTNKAAVHIWKKMGFAVIGVLPRAFNHQQLGYVDALIMARSLSETEDA